MSNVLYFLFALSIGIILGIIYFGGLWLTVRQLPRTENPGLLSWVSFLGRTSIILGGFYLTIVVVPSFPLFYLLSSLIAFFWTRNRIIQQIQPSILFNRSRNF